MFQSTKNRGVAAPAHQGLPANEGEPNTVISVMEAKFVAVSYYDGNGRVTSDMLLEAGGRFYVPPGSTTWASALKEAARWLQEGIKRKLPSGDVKVTDSVEIVGGD